MRPSVIVLVLAQLCARCAPVATPSEIGSHRSAPPPLTTWDMVQARLPRDVVTLLAGDGPDVGMLFGLIRAFPERPDHEPKQFIGECSFGEWKGFVFAGDASDRAVLFINLEAPTAESAMSSCFESLIEKNPGWNLEAGPADNHGIVEYRLSSRDESYVRYAAALDPHMFVLPMDNRDRNLLERWLSGPGVAAGSALATLAGKVAAANTLWHVEAIPQRHDELFGLPIGSLDTQAVYGWVGLDGGNVYTEGHAVLTSRLQASQAAALGRTELAVWAANRSPPSNAGRLQLLAAHGTVWVSAEDNEFVLHSSVSETIWSELARSATAEGD